MKRADLDFLAVLNIMIIFMTELRLIGKGTTEIVYRKLIPVIKDDIFVIWDVEIELLINWLIYLVRFPIVFPLLNTVLSIDIQVPGKNKSHLVYLLADSVHKLE